MSTATTIEHENLISSDDTVVDGPRRPSLSSPTAERQVRPSSVPTDRTGTALLHLITILGVAAALWSLHGVLTQVATRIFQTATSELFLGLGSPMNPFLH